MGINLKQRLYKPSSKQIMIEKWVIWILVFMVLSAMFQFLMGAPGWAADMGAFFGTIWYMRNLED